MSIQLVFIIFSFYFNSQQIDLLRILTSKYTNIFIYLLIQSLIQSYLSIPDNSIKLYLSNLQNDAHYYNLILTQMMKGVDIINQFIKSDSYTNLMLTKEIHEQNIRDVIKEYFPKIGILDKLNLSIFLNDDVLFQKLQRIFQLHQQIFSRIESIEQQIHQKSRNNTQESTVIAGKKVTRAALARRLQKNQEQIRKDQIFVRLTPKSQSCIQFMLSNRNFPRMQVKLSCNQHLEYLVNYLTNKWIRGKVGFKIVLYPDNSFLKGMPIAQKEKALKESLNNYLMFTDVMTCCGVHQNGILNLCYEIVQIKKMTKQSSEGNMNNNEMVSNQVSQSNLINQQSDSIKPNPKEKSKQIGINTVQISSPLMQKASKAQGSSEGMNIKITTPNKFNQKDDYMKDASIFNRNSNFYNNNEQSIFGSLGFNFNFGATPAKRDEHLLSINSINYLDPHFHEAKKMSEQKKDKEKEKQIGFHLKDDRIGLTDIKVEQVNEQASERSNLLQKSLKKQSSQQRQSQQHRATPKEEVTPQQDIKLDTLMSYLQRIQKEKSAQVFLPGSQEESQNNNSNKIKDVKLVNIVKKRTNNN